MARQAVTPRSATIGVVERSVPPDQAFLDRPQRLVGLQAPTASIEHGGQAESVRPVAVTEADGGVDLVVVAGRVPRAVDMDILRRRPDAVPVVDDLGSPHEDVVVPQRPGAGGDLVGQDVDQADTGRADRAEVAVGGVVRPLGVIHAAGDLRHQIALIRIALTVQVGALVDRHAVDEAGEIGAVVEIEAPQFVLRRLALTGVHGDHQSRDGLVELTDPVDRAKVDLLLGH